MIYVNLFSCSMDRHFSEASKDVDVSDKKEEEYLKQLDFIDTDDSVALVVMPNGPMEPTYRKTNYLCVWGYRPHLYHRPTLPLLLSD